MIKLVLACFVLLCFGNLAAQNNTEDFEIALPEEKITNSLYNSIDFIDSRHDTTNAGIVQLGMFNKKAKVIPKSPLSDQLKTVLAALNDNTAKEGELLLQLKQFSFAEVTGATSEKGYCYLRATLYSKNANVYQYLDGIDTVIFIKSLDVTRALFRKGSKAITDFIGKNLTVSATNTNNYSFADLTEIDKIEKAKIKVYTATEYSDGVYKTYESFKNQVPDYSNMDIEFKGEKISGIKSQDENNKPVKIKAKDIYSVIHNGKMYIATDYGYYPLEKKDDDFYFTGKAKVNADAGAVITASVFFGIIGGLIASSSADATFEMKIDHINGGFIRIKELK